MKKSVTKNLIMFFAALVVIAALFSLYNIDTTEIQEIDAQKLVQEINEEKVEKVVIRGNVIEVALTDGTKQTLQKEPIESFSELVDGYDVAPEKLALFSREVKDEEGMALFMKSVLPIILPFILIVAFFWFMFRQVQGANKSAMSFGQSRAREMKPGGRPAITFKDVAGVKEAKIELEEIVEFLKTPKKFVALGAKIPKGVLLVGPPGTGKTLLAKAIAGEANVPFYSISGSEFVEMFVGVGASRVRDLFRKAKKNAPAIVFVDEIDAVGRQRGAGLGGSHDEREQTLNQILTEMDGFEVHTNVIVIAATNRPDVLDPALLRPGRFDRRVVLDLPDINDREEILKVHVRNKPLEKGVEMRPVAERTPGFSGADLENVLNEAAILAARQDKKRISLHHILDSIEKVMLGPERKSHVLSPEEKKVTAYHEAGHALVAHMLPHADPVHKVSIISRGHAAGYTLSMPESDKYLHKKSEFIADLAVLLAGHTTEKEIFGEVTTGASNDLEKATNTARKLITRYGMSDKLVPRIYGEKEELVFLGKDIREQRNYSENVAEIIDHEIDSLISAAVDTARKIITDNKGLLEEIVKTLLEKETIEKAAFEAIVGKKKGIEGIKEQPEKQTEVKETMVDDIKGV
ncbi:TPA: cell division protein FtsH [Candidatus Falkowbacteria bacterium]|nr:cell division protein FtsH [Candidatus Falkowbacteria bacterium]